MARLTTALAVALALLAAATLTTVDAQVLPNAIPKAFMSNRWYPWGVAQGTVTTSYFQSGSWLFAVSGTAVAASSTTTAPGVTAWSILLPIAPTTQTPTFSAWANGTNIVISRQYQNLNFNQAYDLTVVDGMNGKVAWTTSTLSFVSIATFISPTALLTSQTTPNSNNVTIYSYAIGPSAMMNSSFVQLPQGQTTLGIYSIPMPFISVLIFAQTQVGNNVIHVFDHLANYRGNFSVGFSTFQTSAILCSNLKAVWYVATGNTLWSFDVSSMTSLTSTSVNLPNFANSVAMALWVNGSTSTLVITTPSAGVIAYSNVGDLNVAPTVTTYPSNAPTFASGSSNIINNKMVLFGNDGSGNNRAMVISLTSGSFSYIGQTTTTWGMWTALGSWSTVTSQSVYLVATLSGTYSAVCAVDLTAWTITYCFYLSESSGVKTYTDNTNVFVTGATNTFYLADANARSATTQSMYINPTFTSYNVINNGNLYWFNDTAGNTNLLQFSLQSSTITANLNLNGTTFTGTSTVSVPSGGAGLWFSQNYVFYFYLSNNGPAYVCSLALASIATGVQNCVRFDNFTNGGGSASAAWVMNPSPMSDTAYFTTGGNVAVFRFAGATGVLSAAGTRLPVVGTVSITANVLIDATGNAYVSSTANNLLLLYSGSTGFNLTDATGATPSQTAAFPSSITPIIFRGNLYVSVVPQFGGASVYCLDLNTLASQWVTQFVPGSNPVSFSTISNQDVLFVSTASSFFGLGPQQAGQKSPTNFYVQNGLVTSSNLDGTVFAIKGSMNISANRYLGRFVNEFRGFLTTTCSSWAQGGNFQVFSCSGGGRTAIIAADNVNGKFIQGGLTSSTGFTAFGITGSDVWYYNSMAGYTTTLAKQPFAVGLTSMPTLAAAQATRQPNVIESPIVGLAFSQWIIQQSQTRSPSTFLNVRNATNAAGKLVLLACLQNSTGVYAVSVDADSGTYEWATNTGATSGASCVVDPQGPLVLVYTGSAPGMTWALDINTGRVVWSFSSRSFTVPIPNCGFTFPTSGQYAVSYVSMSLGGNAVDGVYPARSWASPDLVLQYASYPGQCAAIAQFGSRTVAADGYGNVWFDVMMNVANANMSMAGPAPVVSPNTGYIFVQYYNQTNSWIVAIDNATKSIAMTYDVLVPYAQPGAASRIGFSGGVVYAVLGSWIVGYNEVSGVWNYTVNYNYNNINAAVRPGWTSTAVVADQHANLQQFNVQTGTFDTTTKISTPAGSLSYTISNLAMDTTYAYVAYSLSSTAQIFRVTPQGLTFESSLILQSGSGAAATPLGTGRGVAIVNGPYLQVSKFAIGSVIAKYLAPWNIYQGSFTYTSTVAGTYYTATRNGYVQKVVAQTAGSVTSPFSWNVSLMLGFTPASFTGYVSQSGTGVYALLTNNTICAVKTADGSAAFGTSQFCINIATNYASQCTFIPGSTPPVFLGENSGNIFFAVSSGQCVFRLSLSGTDYAISAVSVWYSDSQRASFSGSNIVLSDGIYVYSFPSSSFVATVGSASSYRSVALPGATSPVTDGSNFYVGTVNGIASLSGSLVLNWQYTTQGAITTPVTLFGSLVVGIDSTSGGDNQIVAVNTGSGQLAWSFSFTNSQYNGGTVSSVTASSSGVLVVALTTGVVVLNANGLIVWSDFVNAQSRSLATVPCVPAGRIFPVPSSCSGVQLTADTKTFLATCGSSLIARDVASGQVLLSVPATLSSYALVGDLLAYPGSLSIFQQSFTIPAVLPTTQGPATTGAASTNLYATLSTTTFNQQQFIASIAQLTGLQPSDVNVIAWSRDNFGRVLVDFTVPSLAAASALMTTSTASLTTAGIVTLGSAPVASSQAPVLGSTTESAIKAGVVALWIIVVIIVLGAVAALFIRMRGHGHGHDHAEPHGHDHGQGYGGSSPTTTKAELNRPLVEMQEGGHGHSHA